MQLRLSELKLPLDHQPEDLPYLVARTLGVDRSAIAAVEVFKRSFDARKVDLLTVYIADVTLADPSQAAVLLARHADNSHIRPKPDMAYHLPAVAPRRSAPSWSGSAPVAFLRRCCWRKWGSNLWCWNAARPCVNAPATPGACGARTR